MKKPKFLESAKRCGSALPLRMGINARDWISTKTDFVILISENPRIKRKTRQPSAPTISFIEIHW